MKKVISLRLLFCCAIIIAWFRLPAHNTGTIKGVVTDSVSGEKLIGANILAKGTLIGAATDVNGEFTLSNLNEGEYRLVISLVGYKTVTKNVNVINNKTVGLNIKLAPSPFELGEFTVAANQPFTAASSKEIQIIDMQVRTVKSSQDLLKLVPGLITAQHAGGGKAEQIFLRGFDCDHGTDINISVDGIPVNMVSHAHGQGYADLHFLIPETVKNIDISKGPYFAKYGNFSTGGSVAFETRDVIPENFVKIEGGGFNTGKFTMMFQPEGGGYEQNTYGAVQYYKTDGPFDSPLKLERLNVFGKYFTNTGHQGRLTAYVSAFTSAWNASGQIPERAVNTGIIGRFGSIDNMEGGNTSRAGLGLNYSIKTENGVFDIHSYFTDYSFKLFSNFTFFLEDPVNGDMIEQTENRSMHGVNIKYTSYHPYKKIKLKTYLGAGYRGDNVDVELWHSPNRIRMNNITNDVIRERNMFAWISEDFIFSPRFRVQAALRTDMFTFNVNDLAGSATDTLNTGVPHGSGYYKKTLLNPKLNIVFEPFPKIDIYLNFGSGFHTNDARVVIRSQKAGELAYAWENEGVDGNEIRKRLAFYHFGYNKDGITTIPSVYGAETGIRVKKIKNLNFSTSLWYMYVESEFVYVGDGGYADLNKPSVRLGFDFSGRYRIFEWLWADADMTLSRGRITDMPEGKNFIPLSPPFTLTAGLSAVKFHGFDASLRFTHVNSRPANEDNTVVAKGYSIVNAGVAYSIKRFTFSVYIENLFDEKWNEAQFDTESRLKWEAEPVSEIHFTPGNPLNAQFGIKMAF